MKFREKNQKEKAMSSTIIINPDSLWEMTDPHARRYFYATRVFLGELTSLLNRWQIGVIDGKTHITLPSDKDGGAYLKRGE